MGAPSPGRAHTVGAGVDASERSEDAVALAALLARATGAEISSIRP